VHAGYSRYREALIAGGVELHEYRPDASRPAPRGHLLRLGLSESALHAKVIVHDRSIVWIGSANFDPRSRRLNTETGLLIESGDLAGRLLESMERDFGPQQSWKLSLEPDPESGARRLYWNGRQDSRAVRLEREPSAGLWKQLSVILLSLLPIEDLL
jgi:putative cardiolipin synthase